MSRQMKEPERGGGCRIPCRDDEMRSVGRNGGPPEPPRGIADLSRRIAGTEQKQRAAVVRLGAAEYRIDAIADRPTDDRGECAVRNTHVARDAESEVVQRIRHPAREHVTVDARIAVTREIEGIAADVSGERRRTVRYGEARERRRRR